MVIILMDKRPIGVFDSGLGGLTMVKELIKLLPGEDIVYLGDTGRVPYGSRSKATITKYAHQDAAFLAKYDIKTMVVACNTVCSVAFASLKSGYDIPIYGVIDTPAGIAASKTKNGKIGVIGTAATIRSGKYEEALKNINPELKVHSVKCPLFVPLVEEGWTSPDDEAALSIANRYLGELRKAEIDTLILGCTHYPLLSSVISKVMGDKVALVDSGTETAKYVAEKLQKNNIINDKNNIGNIRYFVTDSIHRFSKTASAYLETDVHGKVEQVTIE
ncbi:MAG: glutamate racemase [Oscillospiraceae bacterium]|nr:glutamate racemase [Oscillospiraceae bacterium]